MVSDRALIFHMHIPYCKTFSPLLRSRSSVKVKVDIKVTFCTKWTLWGHLAKPHSSVSSVQDLRKGGCWFYPWLSQCSLRRLVLVIATGFIHLSQLSIVSTVAMWESSQWLGKNIVWSTS